jgi:hypothetical protein
VSCSVVVCASWSDFIGGSLTWTSAVTCGLARRAGEAIALDLPMGEILYPIPV